MGKSYAEILFWTRVEIGHIALKTIQGAPQTEGCIVMRSSCSKDFSIRFPFSTPYKNATLILQNGQQKNSIARVDSSDLKALSQPMDVNTFSSFTTEFVILVEHTEIIVSFTYGKALYSFLLMCLSK